MLPLQSICLNAERFMTLPVDRTGTIGKQDQDVLQTTEFRSRQLKCSHSLKGNSHRSGPLGVWWNKNYKLCQRVERRSKNWDVLLLCLDGSLRIVLLNLLDILRCFFTWSMSPNELFMNLRHVTFGFGIFHSMLGTLKQSDAVLRCVDPLRACWSLKVKVYNYLLRTF